MKASAPRTRIPVRRALVGGAALVAAGLILAWAIPKGMALYYQDYAARWMSAYLGGEGTVSGGFACEVGPASGADAAAAAAAAADLEAARRYDPAQAHLSLLLGKAYCLMGDYPRAAAALEEYGRRRPKDALGFIEAGYLYERLGDLEQAKTEWETANIHAANFIDVATLSMGSRHYDRAIIDYERAVMLGADLVSQIDYARSQAAKSAGHMDQAYALMKQAVDTDHGWMDEANRFMAWYGWGVILYEAGSDADAEHALNQAIQIYPGESRYKIYLSEVYRYLGLIDWRNNDLNAAVTNLAQSVQIYPDNTWGHIHYGKVLFLSNHDLADGAEKEFIAALNLRPDTDIFRNLYDFWISNVQDDRALRLCDQAVRLNDPESVRDICQSIGSASPIN